MPRDMKNSSKDHNGNDKINTLKMKNMTVIN
jgi:hypothetical protein